MEALAAPVELGGIIGDSDKKRQTQACDGCRSKKRRCDGLRPVCTQCLKSRVRDGETIKCTYLTTNKKRGPRRGYRTDLIDRLSTLEKMILPGQEDPASAAHDTSKGSAQRQMKELKAMMQKKNTVLSAVRADIDVDGGDSQDDGNDHYLHHGQEPSPDSGFSAGSSASPEMYDEPMLPHLPAPLQNQSHHQHTPSHVYPLSGGTYSGVTTMDMPSMEPQNLNYNHTHQIVDYAGNSVSQVSNSTGAYAASYGTGLTVNHADEVMFNELDTMMGFATDTNMNPISSSAKIWEVGGMFPQGDSLPSFQFDAEAFHNISVHVPSPTATIMPSLGPQVDLLTHLRDLGLCFHNLTVPNTPFAPNPRDTFHPAILNALYANGASISSHPDLFTQYGSRWNAMRTFAARAEEALMAKGMEATTGMTQAMFMLGGLNYELDDGWKACKWIVEGCNLCTIKQYDRSTNHVGIYAILHGQDEEPVNHLSAEFRETRWMTWASAVLYDSYSNLASGFPAVVMETDYPELLYDRRPWEDQNFYNERKAREAEADRVRLMTTPPTGSLFHDSGWGSNAEGLFRGVGRPPGQSATDMTRMLQVLFLVRRTLRHVARSKIRVDPVPDRGNLQLGADVVTRMLPLPSEKVWLHESLVQWLSSLPYQCRGFDSLAAFRKGDSVTPAPTDAHYDWMINPSGIHNLGLVLVSLAILHFPGSKRPTDTLTPDPSQQQTEKIYRVDSFTGPPIRVTGPQVVTLARRALTYMFKSVHGSRPVALSPAPLRTTPDYAANLRDTPFSPSSPSVPPVLCTSPMIALITLLIVCAELSCPASPAILQECLNDVCTVHLPILDNMGRVFPMAVRYAARMRAIVGGVVGCAVEVGVWKGVWAVGWGVCGQIPPTSQN
ncbi:hypothetical protein DFS34DRAFT_602126 [Phlyctochytrium arcticum]|nr:hypothetical protein DFS34DRAFT_602126 [Phlyctochytrium arcticum]